MKVITSLVCTGSISLIWFCRIITALFIIGTASLLLNSKTYAANLFPWVPYSHTCTPTCWPQDNDSSVSANTTVVWGYFLYLFLLRKIIPNT